MFHINLPDPCLSQVRTCHPSLAAVIRFFMQSFFAYSRYSCCESDGVRAAAMPLVGGGEAQRALAPRDACSRFEEHSLPPTVPRWRVTSPRSRPKLIVCAAAQKAAAKVVSFLCSPSATNSRFEVLFPIILGLTHPSEENRSCCSLGKSSHQGLGIHTWSCSHGSENVPTPAGKLSRVQCSIPGASTPSPRLRGTAAGVVGTRESTEKPSENCQGQPGSP